MSKPEEPETIYVVYLPYLPLGKRMDVGDWELVPRGDLQPSDCLDDRVVELAGGLADLYVLPDYVRGSAGALARPRHGHVGDDPTDPQRLEDLRRACVVAVLDVNQSPLLAEDEIDPNAGHYALTSDNATVVAHGINRVHAFTGAVSGSRVRNMSLGISVLRDPLDPHAPSSTIASPRICGFPSERRRLTGNMLTRPGIPFAVAPMPRGGSGERSTGSPSRG